MTEEEIKKLTTCTKLFMGHVHFVQQSFNLIPDKDHIGTCINYVDLQEYRDEFCKELVNTISEWVYSQQKALDALILLEAEGRSFMNASAALNQSAFEKFRNRDGRNLFVQGQFGELILFNFLQHFFTAVPLLRKMPLTTSSDMERFGSDAIHYTKKNNKNLIYVGEAKTYSSKYQFKEAFKKAIASILNTYLQHRNEIGLYVYDSFIDDRLIEVATKYKNGKLENTEVHLVSIITYTETKKISKTSEQQIKQDIIKIIEERAGELENEIFNSIPSNLYPRFNYIILPVWELDKLIEQFQHLIGK